MNQRQRYHILYFGLLADRRGMTGETIESTAKSAASLYAELDAAHALGLDPRYFRAAVNDEFVFWDHPLQAGDTVAFLPPMSGG